MSCPLFIAFLKCEAEEANPPLSAADVERAAQVQLKGANRPDRLSHAQMTIRRSAQRSVARVRELLWEKAKSEAPVGEPERAAEVRGRPSRRREVLQLGDVEAPLGTRLRAAPLPAGQLTETWEGRAGAARRRQKRGPGDEEGLRGARCGVSGCDCSVFDLTNGLYTAECSSKLLTALEAAGLKLEKSGTGRSLFATRDIPAGTLLCLFFGLVLAASPLFHPYLLRCSGSNIDIIPFPCSMASYFDHAPIGSSECNIEVKKQVGGPPCVVAKRAVLKGEKVCFDYSGRNVSSEELFKNHAQGIKDLHEMILAGQALKGQSLTTIMLFIKN
jgi:hypothetical protein